MVKTRGKDENIGFGCAVLFLAPFCAVGIFTGIQAVRRILSGAPDLEETVLLLIFALVFGGVGFGLLYLAYRSKGDLEKKEILQKQYPDAPWMWRADWAEGRIKDSSRKEIAMAWAFALFILLVSTPLLLALREEVIEKGNTLALLGLIFPIAGLGFLVWAVRVTVRWKRFGVSMLQMTSLPGLVGGPVAGTIETGLRNLPEDGFHLTLRCVRRTRSNRGRNRSTHEKILWQEEQTARKEELYPGYLGTRARFSFLVPFDCEPSSDDNSDNRIVWMVQAKAAVPGVDYSSKFEIPVFRTERSSIVSTSVKDELSRSISSEELQRVRLTSKIQVQTTSPGGREIYFPAARNPGTAMGLTLFLAIWLGVVWLLTHLGAPLLFPVVFGLFGVLIFFGVVSLWLGTSRLRVEAGEVRLKSGILGLGATKVLPAAEIKQVRTKIGMQQGGSSGKLYYDILLVRQSGRDLTVGRYIENKREVEWLVSEIEAVLRE